MLRKLWWFLFMAACFWGAGFLLWGTFYEASWTPRTLLLLSALVLAVTAATLMNVWAYLFPPHRSAPDAEDELGRIANSIERRNDRLGVAAMWALAGVGVVALAVGGAWSSWAPYLAGGTFLATVVALVWGDVLEASAPRGGSSGDSRS